MKQSKKYYKSNKEVLKEQARNKYRKLSEEEKKIKKRHGKNRYKNMSKKSLNEYQKSYRD